MHPVELFKLCYKIIMVIVLLIMIMIIITFSNCQNLVGEYECPLTGTDKKHVNGQNNENMYIFKKLNR